MTKIFSKRNILYALLIIWIIFSAGYILIDQWNRFTVKYYQKAYTKGKVDTIRTIMKQTADCKILPLLDGEKRMEIVSLNCVKKQKKQTNKTIK